jgi:hypothetical protein
MRKIITAVFLIFSLHLFSQEPIFATIGGGDLYSFDLANCTRHFIGATGQGFGDIAFTPDGRLWGIVGGDLYRIDTATANATLIGFTNVQAVTLVGLNDSVLLAESQSILYGINTNNASSYYIDTIGYSASGDLTWYDNDLYMLTPLVKIVLNNTNTGILSVTSISQTIPTCEGAATSTFAGDFNAIIGFNGGDAIKICQVDGSYTPLCPALNPGGTPGAASIRLPAQSPLPVSCSVESVQEQTKENPFYIFPNPANSSIKISTSANAGNFSYAIYNSFGQLIKSGTAELFSEIQTEHFSNGVYSIELKTGDKLYRQNFIINK